MGQIAEAEAIRTATKALDESERIGGSVLSLVTQITQITKQWTALRASAEDADDAAVFDARFADAIAKAKSQAASMSAAEKAVAAEFFNGIFG